ncbi:MAG: hypothetical protein K2M46_01815 [Lachnospiraceae bacterium]|nr:hypothetical protein [Lachnospiraceae bacterium]
MSMEINGKYGQYPTDYAERVKAEQEKVKETEKGQNSEKASNEIHDLQDEYISSEKSGAKPSGLYRLGQDEEGRKKVLFDDPKSVCTINTDKVDREIEKLKEKQQQLEQQIKSTSGDEKKVKELEKKLAQVENELNQKDNNTYRQQNASVSE